MSVTLTYDAQLSRVRLVATAVDGDTAVVQRSTNEIRWTVVRGGAEREVSGGGLHLDDYEFVPGLVNHYRVVGENTQAATITPTIDRVWLKSVARPFLNTTVTVEDVSPITRPARVGVFAVVGRPLPVAVSDVRGGRQWTLSVVTETDSDRRSVDLLTGAGDVLLVQVPAGSRVPAGYVQVGDTSQQLYAVDPVSTTVLPLTEVAAPGADVVGATVTCATLVGSFASCGDVVAEFEDCAAVLEYVADPDVIVVE